jgi:hypothetical protein
VSQPLVDRSAGTELAGRTDGSWSSTGAGSGEQPDTGSIRAALRAVATAMQQCEWSVVRVLRTFPGDGADGDLGRSIIR